MSTLQLFYLVQRGTLAVIFATPIVIPNLSAGSVTMDASATTTTSGATSTFCLGRFQVNLPANSKLSGGNYKYDFISVELARTMSFDEFNKEVAARESKLKSAINRRTMQSMLLQTNREDGNTTIFASWEVEASTTQIKVSGYRWIDNRRFLLEDTVDDDKKDIGISGMRDALAHLRTRSDSDVPNEPGYCFPGGFISNPRWRNEEAAADIDIAGHPDAFVSVWIYPLASHKHDKPLLDRMGGFAQALANIATSVRVLRKGDRRIGPYKGQEHLASAPNGDGRRGHAFVWETQGDGTLDTPAIKIELSTGHRDNQGNPQEATLTDRQAIKLWDEILGSFRLRPVGGAAGPAEQAPSS